VSGFTIVDQYKCVDAVVSFRNLIALDAIWTGFVDANTTLLESDILELRNVARDLEESIVESGRWAAYLKEAFAHDAEIFAVAARSGLTDEVAGDQLTQWEPVSSSQGSFQDFVERSLSEVIEGSEQERAQLHQRVESLAPGPPPPGDIPLEFACGAYVGMGVAAAAIGAGPLAVGAFVAAVDACF
jgi:hypothetical protein